MKIRTVRNEEPKQSDFLMVYIGEHRFRITESIDGKMNINKVSDSDSDLVQVHPRSEKEIELS